MKFPELKGLTLNVFAPSFIWTLAAANMFIAGWSLSGPWFVLGFSAATFVVVGSAWAFFKAATALRDNAGRTVRLLLYASLVGGMVAASWDLVPPMPWRRGEIESSSPKPEPVSKPVAVTGMPFVPVGPERLAYVPANVMALITEARHALEDTNLDVSKCSGSGKGALACRGDYMLAVTDSAGTVAYVSLYEKSQPSKPGYKVTLGRNGGRKSGVNPDIVVEHPPGITVLALKTAINWAGDATWAVYVPYSPEINTPEVRAAGVAYLWERVVANREALRTDGVRSKFFKELVADVIPADHVFTLVLTENVTHPEPFKAGGSNARRLELLNEALAQLGANQTKAWDYRASGVGARGKGQYMPKTYSALCGAYGLTCPSHDVGTRDDNLVFKLMFFHADDEWRGIKNKEWLRGKPMLMRLYLAAGYNGFYGHAAKAIRTCGVAGWRKSAPTCAKPLRDETRPYLDKYAWIYGQHFDAVQNDAEQDAENQ